jgi:hypothetical protein
MAVLDIQRRSQQIGRIRIGHQVKTASGRMRPERLTTFRFTTASKTTADAIADLYGGTVRPWEGQFEVITEKSEIGVTVPPRDAVISQWYEMWTAGGCQRRCDSQHDQISNGPCRCPHASDPSDAAEVAAMALERAALHKADPSKACGLITRINVMIPDLPGLGVFRLDTGSFYAAGESGDKADLMEMAREHNVFLPAVLRIEWRKRLAGGKTTNYPVPVLEILSTFRAIASGALEAAGITAQLPPAPGESRLAITSGAESAAPAAAPSRSRPPTAQDIANAAAKATTQPQIRPMKATAEEHRIQQDMILPPGSDTYEELDSYLHGRWEELAPQEATG